MLSLSIPNSSLSSSDTGRRLLLVYVGDDKHVRAVAVKLEPLGHIFAENGGCKRPEASRNFTLD